MMHPTLRLLAGSMILTAASAMAADGGKEATLGFEFQAPPNPAAQMADFEKRGFKVTYRTADGKELSKADFEQQVKDQQIAMRLDGDAKTVEITIGGELPAELQVPMKTAPGDPLPMLALTDLHGEEHRWPREDGRFTLMNFYFSTCGPCIQEIPELNAFAGKRRDMATLAVTFDDKEETRRFIEQRKLAWDVVPDARAFIEALGVSAYPTFVLVDSAGRLVATRDIVPAKSANAHESLEAWVERTLAGAESAAQSPSSRR